MQRPPRRPRPSRWRQGSKPGCLRTTLRQGEQLQQLTDPRTHLVLGVCDQYAPLESELPLACLAAVHASYMMVQEQTGSWPLVTAVAPLLLARLHAEIAGDEELLAGWPNTLVAVPGEHHHWRLMDVGVIEIESYPPNACRVVGMLRNSAHGSPLAQIIDTMHDIIRAPFGPIDTQQG